MEFLKETILNGTVIYKNSVCTLEITIEGITNTLICDYIVRLGNEPPFRLTQDDNWNWIEDGVGITERAWFAGGVMEELDA